MANIYFNQQVSPRLYRTKTPPSANTQAFFYENHLKEQIKALEHSDIRMQENIETLEKNQQKQKSESNQIQSRMDHLFKLFTNKINEIIAQITDVKNTSAKQNDTHLKNYETQQALLQSIEEKQLRIEQHQTEDNDRTQLILKEINQKIEELNSQIADIKSLSATLAENNEAHQALLQSIEERQVKFEENQHEEIDLTQLLFQELTKKINEIPSQIDEIKNVSAKQTDTLLENHELQQALLTSIDERQLKIEQRQRKDMDLTQSFIQEINEQKSFETQRATQNN